MLALQGYYDGETIQPLEKINAKKNQRLIITVLDDFIPETRKPKKEKTMRGALAEYANPNLREQEKTAWEKAVIEKYGHA